MKKISFLMTSDTHGYWLDRLNHPSATLFNTAATLKTLQAERQNVISIDLGDFIQGSSFATYCSQQAKDGSCFANAMNALNYDFQIIGNHEFNFGQNYRDEILSQLNYPILVSNIINENGEPFIGTPYAIIEKEGVKIGIIGVTTHYIPHWELPAHYKGLMFLDAFETTKKYAEQLRDEVDVLVVAYHGGFERDLNSFEPLEELTGENQGAKMLREIPEIDVLLTGHQHRHINQKVGNAWTVQPGHGGEFVAEVEIVLNEKHQIVDQKGYLHETATAPALESLKSVMEPQLNQGKQWLQTVLGYAPIIQPTKNIFEARRYGHPFVELLNQVQLSITGADFSGVALVNEYFSEFEGEITNETLLKAYPYFNLIATVEISGEDLYNIMEFDFEYFQLDEKGELVVNPDYISPKPKHYNYDLYSGFTTKVDIHRSIGNRIIELIDERTGVAIEREKMYRVAVSQYRAVGGGDYKMFTKEKIREISTIDIATALVEALSKFNQQQWKIINQRYRHIVWQENSQK